MQKNQSVLLLIFLVISANCNHDITKMEEQAHAGPLTIEKAKFWFESSLVARKGDSLRSAGSNGGFDFGLKPLLNWDIAELYDDSQWSVVELPWEYEDARVEVALTEVNTDVLPAADRMPQILRLVILRNKQSGDMYGFKMMVLPDWEYMLAAGKKIAESNYLNRDVDFRGSILFYDLDNKFVNGWMYSDDDNVSGSEDAQNMLRGVTIKTYTYCWTQSVEIGGTLFDPIEYCQTFYTLPHLPTEGESGGGGYNGMFGDTGGDGGGGGSGSPNNNTNNNTNPPPPVATTEADAKKIFRNVNMEEKNWEQIQRMLETIVKNCLGKGLYEGLASSLNGKTLTIQFNNSNASSFSYDGTTAGISLSMRMESNSLFHEMWHAYQAYQETPASFHQSILNQEIETWYAQYLYISSLPEYKQGNVWFDAYNGIGLGKSIQNIKKYVNNNGNLIRTNSELDDYLLNRVKTQFENFENSNAKTESERYPYRNKPYDYNRTGITNFSNLKKLSSNCK